MDAGSGCASDLDCAAPLGRCGPQGVCVGCLSEADCAVGSCDAVSARCVPVPDTCNLAQRLELSGGSATVLGNTERANDDATLSCAAFAAGGNDLVYRLTVASAARLVAKVTPLAGSNLRPVLALRQVCSGADTACAFAPPSDGEARLVVEQLTPGDWFLWVDGELDSSGPFRLDVSLVPLAPGEGCANPLPLGGASEVTATGDTRTLSDDVSSSCGGAGGRDAVYSLTLDQPRRLQVKVVAVRSDFVPVLAVRGAECASPAAQRACTVANLGVASLELPRVEPGTYHLVVDGAQGTAGAYTLSVSALDPSPAPLNDICASAAPLGLSGVGSVTVQGNTTGAKADSLGCGGQGSGNDLVYGLTVTQPSQLLARVTPQQGSGLKPSVYLRKKAACASNAVADELACEAALAPGGIATLVLPRLSAGDYVLWVDGDQGSSGAFELQVDLLPAPPAPPNDRCVGAQPVDLLTTQQVTVQGTTEAANDDFAAVCAVGASSPDVVYAVTLGQARSLGVELKALPGSGLKPVLSVEPGPLCLERPSALGACLYNDPQAFDRLAANFPNLGPGTYFFWVDGDNGSYGDFSLKLRTGAPIEYRPSNDDCGPFALLPTLVPGQQEIGDTRAARNDTVSGCQGPYAANGEEAGDVAFRLSLASTQTVTLTVTPDALDGQLFRPLLSVRGPWPGCSQIAPVLGCQAAATYGGAVTLTLPNLPAGTYTAWVDGAGFSSGRFTIRLQ